MSNIGHIPENTVYIFSNPSKVTTGWEDIDHITSEEVLPAFITDAENKKSIETGKSWAVGYYNPMIWCHVTQTQIPNPLAKKEATLDTVPNDPIYGVRVVGLEQRGKGGRAYKVVLPRGYYVDMREDVMLDLMKTEGISQGGVLNGSFIWARVGGQMKLVRIGSPLHNKLIESTKVVVSPNLTKKDKVVGGVYQNKWGQTSVFLGFVKTNTASFCDEQGVKVLEKDLCITSYGYRYNEAHKSYILKVQEKKKSELWCDIYGVGDDINNFDSVKAAKAVVDAINSVSYGSYSLNRFTVKDSGAVFTKLGDCTMPANVVQLVRDKALEFLTDGLEAVRKQAINSEHQKTYRYSYYNSGQQPVIDYKNSPVQATVLNQDTVKVDHCALANMLSIDSSTKNVPDPIYQDLFDRAASGALQVCHIK